MLDARFWILDARRHCEARRAAASFNFLVFSLFFAVFQCSLQFVRFFSLTLSHFGLLLSSRNVETPTENASLKPCGRFFSFFLRFSQKKPSTFRDLDSLS